MLAALLIAFAPGVPGAEETLLRWETSLPEALKRARSEKRLVMVDFWRDNCIFCVRLEEQTFADRKVQEVLRDFIPVRAKNTDHVTEMVRYGVEGFPTLALLDPEGKPVDINVGFLGPDQFVSWVGSVTESRRRALALEARIAKDPSDLAARVELGRLLSGEGRWEEALARFAEVLEADPGGKRRETAEAHLETGLILRRTREHRRAVESIARAREIVLVRLAGPGRPAAPGAPEKPGTPAADAALLDRVLHELAGAQLLAGNRAALIAVLEEYEAKVKVPDPRRHAWVLLHLGQARKRSGAAEAAERAFRKCDQLYPRSTEARQCREELARLKS